MARPTLNELLKRLQALEERVRQLESEPPACLSPAIGFEISGQPDDESIPYRGK